MFLLNVDINSHELLKSILICYYFKQPRKHMKCLCAPVSAVSTADSAIYLEITISAVRTILSSHLSHSYFNRQIFSPAAVAPTNKTDRPTPQLESCLITGAPSLCIDIKVRGLGDGAALNCVLLPR